MPPPPPMADITQEGIDRCSQHIQRNGVLQRCLGQAISDIALGEQHLGTHP